MLERLDPGEARPASTSRRERRTTAEHAVTQLLAGAPSLGAVGTSILETVCQTLRYDAGGLWIGVSHHDRQGSDA